MELQLRIYKLGNDEKINLFDCGDDDLNEFVLHEAAYYHKAKLAVTYVVVNEQTEEVLAFFSLANDRISVADFPSKSQFYKFRNNRFEQEKQMRSYTATKICRLGVSLSARGLHIGSSTLDFIKSYFIGENKTGCRFLTVDAYKEALPFYYKNGFLPLSKNDEGNGHTRLLYFDLNDVTE